MTEYFHLTRLARLGASLGMTTAELVQCDGQWVRSMLDVQAEYHAAIDEEVSRVRQFQRR